MYFNWYKNERVVTRTKEQNAIKYHLCRDEVGIVSLIETLLYQQCQYKS